MPLLSYSVGQHVSYKGLPATVRFTGQTLWCDDPMEWVGLELTGRHGKHDGVVDGTRYFNAQPQHGLFVRRLHLRPAGVHSELRMAQLAIHAQSPGLSPTMGLPPEENSRLDLGRPGGGGSVISSPARVTGSVLAAAEHERRRERGLRRESGANWESGSSLDVMLLGGSSGRPALDVTLLAAQEALDASVSRRKSLRRASSFGRTARGGGRRLSTSALSTSSLASSPAPKGAASARRSAPASRLSPADDLSPPYRPYSPDAAQRRSCGSRGSRGGDMISPERGSTEGPVSPRRDSWATRHAAAQASRRDSHGDSHGGAQCSAQCSSQAPSCPSCSRTPPTAAGRPATASGGSGSAGGSGGAEDASRRDSWATRHAAACAASRLSSSPAREGREGGTKHVAGWSDRETVKRIISGQWPPAELIG